MGFSEINSLKQAFKLPVIVLTLLTFSTSSSPSRKFIFYRFLVFLTFSIIVLYRVSLLFLSEAKNDRQLQQQQEALQIESVSSVIDWVFAFVVTVFVVYQVLKRKTLKVFEYAAKVDKIFTVVYGMKIDYTKTLLVNWAAFGFVLVFCIIFYVSVDFRRPELVILVFDAFTTFISALFFLIPVFVTSICLELRWRLETLRKIVNKESIVLNYKNTCRELDNLLTVTQMMSEAV